MESQTHVFCQLLNKHTGNPARQPDSNSVHPFGKVCQMKKEKRKKESTLHSSHRIYLSRMEGVWMNVHRKSSHKHHILNTILGCLQVEHSHIINKPNLRPLFTHQFNYFLFYLHENTLRSASLPRGSWKPAVCNQTQLQLQRMIELITLYYKKNIYKNLTINYNPWLLVLQCTMVKA